METTINERVEKLINVLGKNHKTFAESLGKAPTIIYNIANGRNKPSFDVLEGICENYPQLSKDWLLMGTGEMFLENKKDSEKPSNQDDYLHEYLEKLEVQFNRLLNQLETKDRQIEKLMDLLGKPNDVIEGAQVVPLWEENKATA